MTVINVDLDKMINPHFDPILFDDVTNKVFKGGRGSTKSSVISIQLVVDFLQDKDANVLVMRKVANTIGLSVYEQIKQAIYWLHVESLFKFQKSPFRIIHKATGTAFYFSGVDDPQKLKSMVIAQGYVRWMWFEELAEFSSWSEIDMVRASFTRKVLPNSYRVVTYYSYNPPKNPYEWINQWVNEHQGVKNWHIDHSTYKDVTIPGMLSADYLEEIETVKKNDPTYYEWMYLGKVVGLGTNIYNMYNFHSLRELPEDDYLLYIYFSVDVGHEVSATTCLCYGLTRKGKIILLDCYYYSPAGKVRKKAPVELSQDLKRFIDSNKERWRKPVRRMTMDSAEGALDNQMYRDYGIRWHKVSKLKKVDMIDRVQNIAAQGRLFYLNTDANKIYVEEHRNYRWDENTLESADPKVIKEGDHTCDAEQYLFRDNERDFGLKY